MCDCPYDEEEQVDDTMKQTNPKDAIGSSKLPLHLWPASATMLGCLALLDGTLKYGRSNWREAGVRASIYNDAARRHLDAWFEGEDFDPDSHLPHLAHALACLAILVDAMMSDRLEDDRMYRGDNYRAMVASITPYVEELKAQHADKNPQHYTIGYVGGQEALPAPEAEACDCSPAIYRLMVLTGPLADREVYGSYSKCHDMWYVFPPNVNPRNEPNLLYDVPSGSVAVIQKVAEDLDDLLRQQTP